MFNFFFRTTACQYNKLRTNVPLGVLKKCCYLAECIEIQHGHPASYWQRHFLELFPKLLHMKSPDLSKIFFSRFLRIVGNFWNDSKSRITALGNYFQKNCIRSHQTFPKCSSRGSFAYRENYISSVLSHRMNYTFIYIHFIIISGIS